MEEDKLKTLFSDYAPKLTSDLRFIATLRRNLDSVEIIKRRTAELKAQTRRAVILASTAGFVAGLLFSMLIPHLKNLLELWMAGLSGNAMPAAITDHFSLIVWVITGAVAVVTSLNVYELSLAAASRKSSGHAGSVFK